MKNNKELYEFVDHLVCELGEIGEIESAETIRSAKNSSSVGTEVFMALRFELGNLLDKNLSLKAETKRKVMEAINDLSLALR